MSWNNEQYWEYCAIEWIWDQNEITVHHRNGKNESLRSSYSEVVQTLNVLGGERWEIASSAATGNWIFWTLKRVRL